MAQYSTMGASSDIILKLLLLLLPSVLAGCANTVLDGPKYNSIYDRLAALGRRGVIAELQVPTEKVSLGHQWAFMVIPAGRIQVENPRALLANALFQRLAEHGHRPRIISDGSQEILTPDVTISKFDLSCSVPDLFFVRIVKCAVVVHGSSSRAPTVPVYGRGNVSEYKSVGFKPELERVLNSAITMALDDFLHEMQL